MELGRWLCGKVLCCISSRTQAQYPSTCIQMPVSWQALAIPALGGKVSQQPQISLTSQCGLCGKLQALVRVPWVFRDHHCPVSSVSLGTSTRQHDKAQVLFEYLLDSHGNHYLGWKKVPQTIKAKQVPTVSITQDTTTKTKISIASVVQLL